MSMITTDAAFIWGPWVSNAPGGMYAGYQAVSEKPGKPKAKIGPLKADEKTGRQIMYPLGATSGIDGVNTGFAGAAGLTGNRSDESNASAAFRRTNAGIASTYFNYRRMRADGIVAIGREFADALIVNCQWAYDAAPEEKEIADEIKAMWEKRGQSGASHEGRTLRQALMAGSCRAKDMGNVTFEVVYGDDDETEQIAVTEFCELLPEYTRPLVFEGTRKFAGVRNWGLNSGPVDLDPEYCARFIYDSEGGDLFGRSRFENCKEWIGLKWDIRDKIRTDLNTTIGNIMHVEAPMDDDGDDDATDANKEEGLNIGLSLARGQCVVTTGFSIKDQIAMAQASVDPSKVNAWKINRIDTGQNNFEGFERAIELVDNQVLYGLLTLPRAVKEAQHGSRADAEAHTDTMVVMSENWITYAIGIANNITDVILKQRYGKEYCGRVTIRPATIDEEAKEVLTKAFEGLLSDKAFALKLLDLKAAAEKLKIKLNEDFDQDELLDEMENQTHVLGASGDLSSAERLRKAGYDEQGIAKIKKERSEEDIIPTDPDNLGRRPASS